MTHHFPLALAVVCVNCEAVFALQRNCPACTSTHCEPVENFLTRRREAAQRAAFIADVERDMTARVKEMR